MGRGDEARFIRGGGEVDALFQHVPEEGLEEFLGGLLRGVQVIDLLFREEEAEHGARAVEGVVFSVSPESSPDAFLQARAELFQAVIRVPVQEFPELGQARRHGDRVAGEGARLVHGAERGKAVHDFRPAAEGSHREAAADDLPHAGEVRRDAVKLLYAAGRDAEARHDFVKDEQGVVAERDFPQEVEETVLREVKPGVGREGLQDDGGDVVPMELKGFLHCFPVIVGNGDGELGHLPGNACAVRLPEGERAGACRHQQGVHMAVVAPDEFDDFAASGVAARQPDGGHGGFRAGVYHAHFFHGGHHFRDHFRHIHFRRSGNAVAQPPVHGGMDGVHDGLRGVAQDGRAPRADVVNELASVRVRDVRAFGGLDKEGVAVHIAEGSDGGVDAAGDDGARAGEKLGGLIHVLREAKRANLEKGLPFLKWVLFPNQY